MSGKSSAFPVGISLPAIAVQGLDGWARGYVDLTHTLVPYDRPGAGLLEVGLYDPVGAKPPLVTVRIEFHSLSDAKEPSARLVADSFAWGALVAGMPDLLAWLRDNGRRQTREALGQGLEGLGFRALAEADQPQARSRRPLAVAPVKARIARGTGKRHPLASTRGVRGPLRAPLPAGNFRPGFYDPTRQQHWSVTKKDERNEGDWKLTVGNYNPHRPDGTLGEFTVVFQRRGRLCYPRLEVFYDGWQPLFGHMPHLVGWLALHAGQPIGRDEFARVLLDFQFYDLSDNPLPESVD